MTRSTCVGRPPADWLPWSAHYRKNRRSVRTLLVASTGGHLLELHRLRSRLNPRADDVIWVTADTDQSRSLLAGEDVIMVERVEPRGYRAVARNGMAAVRILRETGAERVISTGAGIALSFLPLARARGLSCHYIESAARTYSPSTTGTLLRAGRACNLYAQHPAWARGPWSYRGSVFDDLEVVTTARPSPIRRVLVTVGTLRYPFQRLVDRLRDILPSEVDVLWQLGFEPCGTLPGTVVSSLTHDALAAAMKGADVVICHAGVGSALLAHSVGHRPILVPRRLTHGEHIDDHQIQVAALLGDRQLAVACAADEIDWQHLDAVARTTIRIADRPRPFRLNE